MYADAIDADDVEFEVPVLGVVVDTEAGAPTGPLNESSADCLGGDGGFDIGGEG